MRGTTKEDLQKSVPEFARGLPILLVDHDTSSLTSVSSMLQSYSFNVTVAQSTNDAMSIIPDWDRNYKDRFKLVMAHLSLANLEDLLFLQTLVKVGLQVILISSDGNTDDAQRAIAERACLYLEKPIVITDLECIWKQAFQRKTNVPISSNNIGYNHKAQMDPNGINMQIGKGVKRSLGDGNLCAPMNKKILSISTEKVNQGKGKFIAEESTKGNVNRNAGIEVKKKPRIVWTKELHLKFMNALSTLGDQCVRPKSILRMMNVPNLTLLQVASHLQKYRSQVEQISQVGSAGSTSSKKQRGSSARIGTLRDVETFGFESISSTDPSKMREFDNIYCRDLQRTSAFVKPMDHWNLTHPPRYQDNLGSAPNPGRSDSPSKDLTEKESPSGAEGTKTPEPNTSAPLKVDLMSVFSPDCLSAEFNLDCGPQYSFSEMETEKSSNLQVENPSFKNSGSSANSNVALMDSANENQNVRGYDELMKVFEEDHEDLTDLEGKLSRDDVDKYTEWLKELLMAPGEDGSSFHPLHSTKL